MIKVLVVDDEKQFIDLMQIRLESKGYEVIAACNGREGLEKAKSENPDLIILDIMMPKLDGFEVCHLLKNDAQYNKIPIILCTAMAQKVDSETSQRVKADAYITKPFDSVALLSKIDELLEKSTVRRSSNSQ